MLATAEDATALAAAAGTRLRENESWEDLFFRLLLERVEPRLGRSHPTFLTHWPAAQAALARRDPADPRVAERFELFVCGIELANAFVELTDADEQRARFEADRARRHAASGPDWPLDEDFLAALAFGMPPSAGIAMGFDRLAMIASGARSIDQVLWLIYALSNVFGACIAVHLRRPSMFPVADFRVADDFAAIAKRLKEIEWEAAMETAAAEFMRQRQLNNERRPDITRGV